MSRRRLAKKSSPRKKSQEAAEVESPSGDESENSALPAADGTILSARHLSPGYYFHCDDKYNPFLKHSRSQHCEQTFEEPIKNMRLSLKLLLKSIGEKNIQIFQRVHLENVKISRC